MPGGRFLTRYRTCTLPGHQFSSSQQDVGIPIHHLPMLNEIRRGLRSSSDLMQTSRTTNSVPHSLYKSTLSSPRSRSCVVRKVPLIGGYTPNNSGYRNTTRHASPIC